MRVIISSFSGFLFLLRSSHNRQPQMQRSYLCLVLSLAVVFTSAAQQEEYPEHAEYFNMARDHTISIKAENNNQSRPMTAPGIPSQGL